MKKVILPLKQISSNSNTIPNQLFIEKNVIKSHKITLPKVSKENQSPHNALTALVLKLETFLTENHSKPLQLIQECLQYLKTQLGGVKSAGIRNSLAKLREPSVKRTSKQMHHSELLESHVISLNRSQLKKVNSRDLFNKIQFVKQQHISNNHHPAISSHERHLEDLKNKLEQKQQVIVQLKTSIAFIQGNLEASQLEIANLKKNLSKIEQQAKDSLEIETKASSQDNGQTNVEQIIQMLNIRLKQREQECISLWLMLKQ